MKNHFIALLTAENLRKTVILLGFAGLVFLFFALLHPWKKASRFAVLTAVCLVILAADFIWPFVSEGVAMSVVFVRFMAGFFAFFEVLTAGLAIYACRKGKS